MKPVKSALLLVLLLGLLVPAYLWTQDSRPLAVLKPQGYVTVNGQPVHQTTVLFPGDVVRSGSTSTAVIMRFGSSITLPKNSSAAVDGTQVRIAPLPASYKEPGPSARKGDDNRDRDGGDDRDDDDCKPMSPHKPKHHHQRGTHHECEDHD